MIMISWEGIDLRPVCVKGPWKLIREGNGFCKGMEFSLDVVAVLVHQRKHTERVLIMVMQMVFREFLT